MFPVLLNLQGKQVLVIGGGSVGRRKALTAAEAGADVRLLALEPRPLEFSHHKIEWRVEPYANSHLEGMSLVFAAASREVNNQVRLDAGIRGIWMNSATDDGDLLLPAFIQRGSLTIAVSTSGASPAFARRVRERLEAEFDESIATFLQILQEVRDLALERVGDPARRRELLEDFGDWSWLEQLRRDGPEIVKERMLAFVDSSV